jgi:hypothetical protein
MFARSPLISSKLADGRYSVWVDENYRVTF